MKTGMEPFFEFLNAIRYAIVMFRIERDQWKQYRGNMR